jgi:hypothetical protein
MSVPALIGVLAIIAVFFEWRIWSLEKRLLDIEVNNLLRKLEEAVRYD